MNSEPTGGRPDAYHHNPYDIDVEQALLGAVLRDNGVLARIRPSLKPEHFYDPLHGRIFDTMSQMIECGGVAVTPLTLHATMKSDPGVIETEGQAYFNALRDAAPAIPDVKAYADILTDLAVRRSLIRMGEDIINAAHAAPTEKPSHEQIEEAERALKEVALQHRSTSGSAVRATPFSWIEPESIPPRKFLFQSRHAIAGFATATAGLGGTGKSSLTKAEALAHCTGRNLLDDKPLFRGRSWLLELEDPFVEHQRRVVATALLHKVPPIEFEGRLFLDTAEQGFVVARQTRDGVTFADPLIGSIIQRIKEDNITFLSVDPFVACHSVSENDNEAINKVAKVWTGIAEKTGCAIDLVMHLRKGNGSEPSADDVRGGSSQVAAFRSARLLATMDADQAKKFSVAEHLRFFRIVDVKRNMAARDTDCRWRELMPIDLKNGNPSDHVAAVQAWAPPNPSDTASPEQMEAIRAAVAGGKWRENVQATAWVGKPIADVLQLDLTDDGAKESVKRAISQWLKDKTLRRLEERDEKSRKMTTFVVVG